MIYDMSVISAVVEEESYIISDVKLHSDHGLVCIDTANRTYIFRFDASGTKLALVINCL